MNVPPMLITSSSGCGLKISTRLGNTPARPFPIVDVRAPGDSKDFEGTLEVLFTRNEGHFEYCCSQSYDKTNIDKHNPDFPWLELNGN